MLSFLPGFAWFAVAGLAAAAGPVIIHLLNRRRFRVVHWAAMDFLLEAVVRSRRIMHLRDLLLLLLRTAAVALFGLALARPYFTRGAGNLDPDQPLHAVLILDNSLSMGYRRLAGDTLLDEAKQRAIEFLEALPDRSLVSVLPLCGSEHGYSLDPYRTRDDALAALSRIEVLDRRSTAAQLAELALQACQQTTEVPATAKRVVFFSDQQATVWPGSELGLLFADVPELQVVDVSAGRTENTWVDSLVIQDGVADVETPATFLAQVRHVGVQPRNNVVVTLEVDGTVVDSKRLDLEPGQTAEVLFKYRFEDSRVSGLINQVPVMVSLPADALPEDDRRFLSVPVVASLPVVFVDQYGDDEDPRHEQYGETYHLRRLLAPKTSRLDAMPQLVKIKHLRMEQLELENLRDARLVVMAGVTAPDEAAVRLLRDYVNQGGQIIIAAGAQFDPAAWNEIAWRDGGGILPAPLAAAAIGQSLDEAGDRLQPFFLNFDTMSHAWFQLPNTSRDDHVALYTSGGETGWKPVFFKAVAADVSPVSLEKMLSAERARIRQEQESLDDDERRPAEDLVERTRPRVLAAFGNGVPWMIERTIGQGQVLFVSSGVFSPWNMLPKTDVMFVFDRIMRSMIERTLPNRNLGSTEPIVLLVTHDRLSAFSLRRPDGSEEPLTVEALGGEEYGVTVRSTPGRGIYTIVARRPADVDTRGETRLWEVPFAVNGPSEESELASLTRADFEARFQSDDGQPIPNIRWVDRQQSISVEGVQVWGQNLWWWLAIAVLACLLAEILMLSFPAILARRRHSNTQPAQSVSSVALF